MFNLSKFLKHFSWQARNSYHELISAIVFHKISYSYYIVVVFIVPLQGLFAVFFNIYTSDSQHFKIAWLNKEFEKIPSIFYRYFFNNSILFLKKYHFVPQLPFFVPQLTYESLEILYNDTLPLMLNVD